MVGDLIDTFKNSAPTVMQGFEKIKLRQVPVTLAHIPKIDISIMSFQITPFCCPKFKKFAVKNAKNSHVSAKKRPFFDHLP